MNFITYRLSRTAFRVALLFVFCTFFLCNKSDAVTYTITDIGALNLNFSWALDINNHSQVTGNSGSPSKVILYENGTLTNLGGLGKNLAAFGLSINNLGQITGYADPSSSSPYDHAIFYDGSTIRDIGTLGGNRSYGYGINDSGHIVGLSDLPGDPTWHAFIYDGTSMRDLGTLGGNLSWAYAINNNGYITGSSNLTLYGYSQAFLYDGTTMREIATFGGSSSVGHDINELGQVVGGAALPSGGGHAFFYDGSTTWDLGTLDPNLYSEAYGLNNLGQVVGSADAYGGSYKRAFVYDHLNGMVDLNTLIPQIPDGF